MTVEMAIVSAAQRIIWVAGFFGLGMILYSIYVKRKGMNKKYQLPKVMIMFSVALSASFLWYLLTTFYFK